jgi:transposase-like protein
MEAIVGMVYPEGIACRKCQMVRPHHKLTGRKAYSCDYCGTHVYPLAGTIFEKSTTPLKSWFYAMYIMGSTRCGISAKQLERELGVTYKTAWRIFTQIRKLMDEDGGMLTGEVEVDETYVGGKPRGQVRKDEWGHTRPGPRPGDKKAMVIGAVERGGKFTTRVIPDRRLGTVVPLVVAKVMPSATVFTDDAPVYDRLNQRGYAHHRINHSAKVYVKGNVHTQTIEAFWSLLKNGIRGAHHAVGAAYLQSYVNEYAFRYHHRDDAQPMFGAITGRVSKTRHGRYGAYAPVGE